jgi:hypothetical protein
MALKRVISFTEVCMRVIKQIVCTVIASVLLVSVFIIPSEAKGADTVQAEPTRPRVLAAGSEYLFDAYLIDGCFYFNLSDIAYALRGTAKQFQATFDGLNKDIGLTSRTSGPGSADTVWMPYDVYLDGREFILTAYIIGASSYVKLRDLAAALDFDVKYSKKNDTIMLDTSAVYGAEPEAGKSSGAAAVTFIGDSIGVDVAPYLKKYYPSLYTDAKVSRQFSAAKGIIQRLLQKDALGSIVVIELGTNGAFTAAQMRSVIELIGSDRKIVFVNTRMPRTWCATVNDTLATVCAEYGNTRIADWYGASADQPGWFHDDGVHPSGIGSKALAKVIADTIERAS